LKKDEQPLSDLIKQAKQKAQQQPALQHQQQSKDQ